MSAAKKPSAARSSAQKTARKKTTTKKTASQKATAKKTTAKSPAAKTARARSAASQDPKSAKASRGAKTNESKTSRRKSSSSTGKTSSGTTAERKPAAKASRAQGGSDQTAKPSSSKRRGKRPGLPPLTLKKSAARKAPPPRPAKFDKRELQEIRQRLEGERAELEERIDEIEASIFERTQSDLTGEAGFDEDFADAGTATFDRERELSIQNNIRDLIGQIDRAIGRIEDGSYGTCERCGKPIDASRLRALPHALLCMDCKRREERAR